MTTPVRILAFSILATAAITTSVGAQTCQADFSYTLNGLSVQFTQQSSSSSPITAYLWNFGDGSTSTQSNPTHTFGDAEDFLVCLSITSANGCTDQFCTDVEPCQLNISVSNGDCNANGEIPIAINVSDFFGNAKNVNISIDGVLLPGSPYLIDDNLPVSINTLINGDGQQHLILAISTHNNACGASYTFTAPDCGSNCFLSGLSVSLVQENIKTVNIGDNFFNPQSTTLVIGDVLRFNWTAGGHTSTSDATTGPDSWNSGVLGTGGTYDVHLKNPGLHPFYCVPHGGPGGIGMSGLVIANCPVNNHFTLQINFNTTQANSQGYNLLIDGVVQPGSPFPYLGVGAQSLNATLAGDGQNHIIEIRDLATPACGQTRTFLAPDCGAVPACSMSLVAQENGACSETNQVPVNITVNSINGGAAGFRILLDGLAAGAPYFYDPTGTTTLSVQVPGDGLPHVLTAQDVLDSLCIATDTLITSNCTLPCQLSDLQLTNNSAGNPLVHTVEVVDFSFVPSHINVSVGDIVRFVWNGHIQHTSTSDASTGPDTWNSGLLGHGSIFEVTITTAGVHPYYCIPHGAPGGIGMAGTITATPPCNNGQVSVSASFSELNAGVLGYNVKIDGVLYPGSPFAYEPLGINAAILNLPGDGLNHLITVEDAGNSGCSVAGNLQTPVCAPSGPCSLILEAAQVQNCDASNQVGVPLTIQHTNTGTQGYFLLVDGNPYPGGPFPYTAGGTTLDTIFIAGTGQLRSISVQDSDSTQCTATVQVATPQCGAICEVQDLQVITGPQKRQVLVRDFDFMPASLDAYVGDTIQFVWTGQIAHTSTSDAISGPNSWNSGLLNAGSVYNVVISQPGNHPYYCIPHGGPGGIGMSGLIHALPACNNGQTNIDIQFTVTNGSAQGYRVFYDGQLLAGPLPYDNPTGFNEKNLSITGDGAQHVITVQDLDVNFCAASLAFTAPFCEQLCLIQNIQAQTGAAVVHQVEVVDFAFAPQHLNARIGETIRFVWSGAIPHSVTSDAITGPDSWDSGIISQGSVFDVVLQTPGLHRYYCIPHGGPGGIGMAGSINASPVCQDGLVNVSVSFEVSNGSSLGYQVYVDGVLQLGGPQTYDDPTGSNVAMLGVAGDGLTHFITIQDMEVPFCAATISIQTPNCNAGCTISQLDIQFPGPQKHLVEVRDFNFTPQHLVIMAGDTVEWVWAGAIPHTSTSDAANGPNSWNSGFLGQGAHYTRVFNSQGEFPYYCIPHGGPGGIGMAGTIAVNSPCENGLSTATLSFSATGTGNQGYQVFIDGIAAPGNPHNYAPGGNNLLSLQVNGDGNIHTLSIQDLNNSNCYTALDFSAPLCPNACQLSVSAVPLGGCNAQNQVSYQIMVMAAQVSNLGFNLYVDNMPLAGNPYAYGIGGMSMLEITLPGDGQTHQVSVVDAALGTCTASTSIQSLNCGQACSLMVSAAQSGACNNADQVPFSVSVQALAPGSSGFDLMIDGVLYPGSPFAYQSGGMTLIPVLLPGDGALHLIQVVDVNEANCQYTINIPTPQCGLNCAMGGFTVEYNVPQVFIVEVRDFDFFPDDLTVSAGDTVRFVWTGQIPHTTTSDVLGQSNSWNSGLLGQGAVYDLVLQTIGDHPYYCIPHGSPGGIGMAGLIHVQNPCDDGQLGVRITFNASNGSFQGYSAYLDDNQLVHTSPYELSGLNQFTFSGPGDGAQHHVLIQDANDPDCFLHEHFTLPDCSDPCFGFSAQFTYQINPQTLEVQFSDGSTGQAAGWMWMFGDGQMSNDANPTHIYEPGSYLVCLAVENNEMGCMDVFCDSITIGLVVCEPFFSLENDGLTVFFKNESQTSQPINNWIWTLGNGQQISGVENPTFTYSSLGIYQICLTITTDSCIATYCQQLDLSNPCLAFEPDFSYTIDLENLSVQFSDQTTGNPHRWLWGFGDGITSSLQNPSHSYSQPGVYNICLLVQDTVNSCNKAFCELLYMGVTGTQSPETIQRELVVFPNPAATDVSQWHINGIEQQDYNQLIDCKISNLHGQILHKGSTWGHPDIALPVSFPLAAGLYFIEIRSARAAYYGKILIQ